MSDRTLPIAILGAGPVGLDAALAAIEANRNFRLYEAGSEVGSHVRDWGHVRLFSPWRMNVSHRMRRHLEAAGVEAPDGDDCPTGRELVSRLLEPVARLPEVASRVRLGERVMAVGREGLLKHEEIGTLQRAQRPFRLLVRGRDGRERVDRAETVLDCTGKWGNPNMLGDGGIPAPGEKAHAGRIVRRIPDLRWETKKWSGRTILLVGAGHSAQTAARELVEHSSSAPGTRILWAVRSEEPNWGAVPNDPLPERAALVEDARTLAAGGAPALDLIRGVVVEALEGENSALRVRLRRADGVTEEVSAHAVISLTGAVGEHALYRQLQVHECYATSGPMKLAAALLGSTSADCLEQESHGVDVLRSPEPGFYLMGDKSYGRNNTFLLRVGWRQVDEVFEAMAS